MFTSYVQLSLPLPVQHDSKLPKHGASKYGVKGTYRGSNLNVIKFYYVKETGGPTIPPLSRAIFWVCIPLFRFENPHFCVLAVM
jgi:hypothetical protein